MFWHKLKNSLTKKIGLFIIVLPGTYNMQISTADMLYDLEILYVSFFLRVTIIVENRKKWNLKINQLILTFNQNILGKE